MFRERQKTLAWNETVNRYGRLISYQLQLRTQNLQLRTWRRKRWRGTWTLALTCSSPFPIPWAYSLSPVPIGGRGTGLQVHVHSFILLEPVELVLRRLTFMPSTSTTAQEPYQAEKVFCMEVNEELQQRPLTWGSQEHRSSRCQTNMKNVSFVLLTLWQSVSG